MPAHALLCALSSCLALCWPIKREYHKLIVCALFVPHQVGARLIQDKTLSWVVLLLPRVTLACEPN